MFASKDSLLTRPSGYNIARSVRLRSSASAYFNRTPATTTNQRTWTWSAWVKRGVLTTDQTFFSAADTHMRFGNGAADTLWFNLRGAGATNYFFQTTQVFRDPSAWYHIVLSVDTTQATASNRAKLYSNGVQITTFTTSNYPPQNTDTAVNSTTAHTLGSYSNASIFFDGYLTEINLIDGQQLTPSSFGETDSITGVWKPKAYSGTYGTNGFELNFSDNSTSAALGTDFSGNSNTWTVNNISVTAGTTYDSMTDVPTLTSATAANYGVMNPVAMTSNVSATNGNLTTSFTGLANAAIYGTFLLPTSGKWYFESTISTVNTATSQDAGFGIVDATTTLSNISAQTFSNGVIYRNRGDSDSRLVVNGSSVVSGNTYSWSTNDVVQIAYDADSGKVWVGRNNSWFDTSGGTTGNPSSGTNQIGTLTTTINMLPVARAYSNTLVMNWNFGQQPFTYTPPTGFVALNTYNLPASTITNGAAYMAATLYSANNGAQTITNTVNGISFQPDFVWTKSRSNAYGGNLYDSVRGIYKSLISSSTGAESTDTLSLTAFNSNGYSLNANDNSNYLTGSSVGWQWKAGTTSASNTNGSITSTVSVGATQGFSVVTYTGNGSSSATVGHGLGVVPSMIINKTRSGTVSWFVKHTSLASNLMLTLDTTDGTYNGSLAGGGGLGNLTSSTTFGFVNGTSNVNNVNASGSTYVAYCFAAVAGYSAFGSYTGNASADGTFVYLGFRPRFVLMKYTSAGGDWYMYDSTRSPINVSTAALVSNSSAAEISQGGIDFLSNGFKLRASNNPNVAATYIYMAFAESPFRNALAR